MSSTALALWMPPSLVCRRSLVLESPVFALDTPKIRFHFAFLASIKRGMVQAGAVPSDIEPAMHKGHLEWWQRSSRTTIGYHVEMQEATLEQIVAIVVPVAQTVDLGSARFPWYPDGWRPLVAWAASGGGPMPKASAGIRVIASGATTAERTAHLSREERLDAEPIDVSPKPPLRVVQVDAGPLFDDGLPPFSDDLEAEIVNEWERDHE